MTRHACGGPDSPGGTHWSACDCEAERLRREGATAERRVFVEPFLQQLEDDVKRIAARIQAVRLMMSPPGERGESEGG